MSVSLSPSQRPLRGGAAEPVYLARDANVIIVDSSGTTLQVATDGQPSTSGIQAYGRYSIEPTKVADGNVVAMFCDNQGRLWTANFNEFSSDDSHMPALADEAAIVTYAATPGYRHQISGIAWSYNAQPTGGLLTITAGGNNAFSVFVTSSGPGFFDWDPPIRTRNANTALVVTLAAGGGAVRGSVNVKGYRLI